MTYEVQVQRLEIDTYHLTAVDKKAVKEILKKEGVFGLARRSMNVEKGSEQIQLLSVAEME